MALNLNDGSASNEIYRFGAKQQDNRYLMEGWGEPEDGFVWSEGSAARVILPSSEGSSKISVSLWGFVSPTVLHQEVLIFVNGVLLGIKYVSNRVVLEFNVGATSSNLDLTFYLPTACSPSEHDGMGDLRQLSVALATIQVEPAASGTALLATRAV